MARLALPASFQGADLGADVALSGGRRLWLYGDTLRAAGWAGARMVRNSALVESDSCLSVVVPPDRGALIPDRADGVGYWPMSAVVMAGTAYDVVTVLAQRVRTRGPSSFVNLGTAVAVLRVPRGGLPGAVSVSDVGPDDPDRRRTTWGAAAWTEDDGWTYLFGTSNPEQPYAFGWSLHVARTRMPADVSTWRYWDGQAWQRDPSRAATLIDAHGGVSQTLSVFARSGRWYAVSERDGIVGGHLVVWSSPGPVGPYVAGRPLAAMPSYAHVLHYLPLAHPDLPARAGHLVVSVCQGSDDLGVLTSTPGFYLPRFLEIPLTPPRPPRP